MKRARTDIATVPVFILCGGMGTRLREETELRPKPMVPIGNRPILWHIMKIYAWHGFRRFVLCLGYKGAFIKSYFLDYASLSSDFTVNLATNRFVAHARDATEDWDVTLADTGETTMTGARVAIAARRYLGDAPHFAVTYGDGVTDADLCREYDYHLRHGKAGTVLGVNPPSRFGEIKLQGRRVAAFSEKPDLRHNWINGGFFFFRRPFLSYLSDAEQCILEREPLTRLADDGQLNLFQHRGFWACMDTQRDREHLTHLVEAGQAPWMKWQTNKSSGRKS